MRNRYPGLCYRCGELVKAGEGFFEKLNEHRAKSLGIEFTGNSKWITQHSDCANKFRGTLESAPKDVVVWNWSE